MKSEDISNAMGLLDDEMIAEAAKTRKKRRGRSLFVGIAAAAACLCLVLVDFFGKLPGDTSNTAYAAYAIAEADYPEMAPYPDESEYIDSNGDVSEALYTAHDAWWEDKRTQRNQPEGYKDGLEEFFALSMPEFLSETEGENLVYSPLNIYMALSMLTELTDGESRAQVLEVLNVDNVENMRIKAKALWNAHYSNDGATKSILANSLWLNQNIKFRNQTMNTLTENYYTSSYQGEMGSTEFNQALQDWLNAQTDGLLDESVSGVELDQETVLALASTICFRAKWMNEFREEVTERGVFHSAKGDVKCKFMHQSGTGLYYWSEQFAAIERNLENSGSMWFFLPDEGIPAETLLTDENVGELLFHRDDWKNQKYLVVNQSIPKFDVVSDFDLSDGLKALGITDIFDAERSDFSPMTSDINSIFLSQAEHAARVMIDEEGCTAAAYTMMAYAGAGMPPDEKVDFVVDRPFLFVLTGWDGLPLFAGIVNQP